MNKIILRNLRASVTEPEPSALRRAAALLKKEGISYSSLSLCKRSLDARKKNDIHYICSVIAETEQNISEKKLACLDAVPLIENSIKPLYGSLPMNDRPLVVGFGPCGMFCALLLAENGYSPIVIERGGDVSSRKEAVKRFYESRALDTECNIQFGAGGAGTFSDGKLLTRINDGKCSYVLRRLVEFGAPEDILINAKPHIGTDLLEKVVSGIAKKIEASGGEILYNTKMQKVRTDISGHALSVLTNKGEIPCGTLTLALGHSARDTYMYLINNSFVTLPKAFSVGVRVEHLQSELNYSMYGDMAEFLPPAEYSLSKRAGERGVYSFCMCPGGEVVAAASEEGGVVTNGMSSHSRNLKNANSAIAVSVLPEDYENSSVGAIEFQRGLERAAFAAGGGNYNAPLQTLGDFMIGSLKSEPTRVEPSYMGKNRYTLCKLDTILPHFVCEMLRSGFDDFGRKIKGFDAPYALLTGVETRTSSPIRILRNENMTAVGHDNIYPCGEGAGYAGGITSASVDGISCALEIMRNYKAPVCRE